MKRIFLFLIVNILIITTISLIISVLHLKPYISHYGINYKSLLIFCFIWGMGGSFISLLLSKHLAKWLMKVKIITNPNDNEKILIDIVKKLANDAGLKKTPEVGIYFSNEVNAFATGPSKNKSLIAVSSGLLNKMDRDEIQAVLGHEISHITNGDMVTMTLLQGVINSFAMFLARVLAYMLAGKDKNKNVYSYWILTEIFQFILMILGFLGIAAFSRFREFRADRGSANLIGKAKMIKALQKLQTVLEIKDKNTHPIVNSLKISNTTKKINLFSTHPSLEKRIEKLRSL